MTTHELAVRYIREQLEIIRKHGGTPRLTADQRREAIAAAQKTFEAMRARHKQGETEADARAEHRAKDIQDEKVYA